MSTTENLLEAVTGATTRVTTIQTTVIGSDSIVVEYEMMPGARPTTAGAAIAVWQNANVIPWDNDLTFDLQPIGPQQRGSLSLDTPAIQDNNYIVGLLVASMQRDSQKARNTAATVFVPAGTDPQSDPRHDSLTLVNVGTSSVTVQYNALANYQPLTNGAWLGLWRGEEASYNAPPDWVTQIKLNGNIGTVGFSNVSIGRGLTYTVGMFLSGWSTDPSKRSQVALACSLTFTQGQ